MRFFRQLALWLATILLLMNTGCVKDKIADSNIVVTFDNNHSITTTELDRYVKDWLYYKKYQNRPDAYKNALRNMVTNQLKRIDFFEKGLDKNEGLMQSIMRIVNEGLIAEYFETQYLGKYASEEKAKQIYGMMNKEVVYQLMEIKKPENASQKQLDSLQEKALEIKSELDNGKDFSSVAKEYSLAKNYIDDGNMPAVDWKQSMSNPVSNIIFNLNKNDVGVLNSDDAFSIVKIADIKEIHIEPFDSVKSEIISDLKKGYAETSLDEYEKDKKELIDEKSLKWNQTALKQIVKWSAIPDF